MCFGASFWKNALPYGAVGVAAHRERPVLQVRHEHGRDGAVVAEQVALRDPLVGPERLVEVREPQLALARRGRRLGDAARSRVTSAALLSSRMPEVGRVAQAAVVRPLAEPHLGDELRLDPLHVALAHPRHLRRDGERRRVALRAASGAQQLVDLGVVEAGADVADVAQLAALVDAEHERAERAGAPARRRACSRRRRTPRRSCDLDLQPVARPLARRVGASRRASR